MTASKVIDDLEKFKIQQDNQSAEYKRILKKKNQQKITIEKLKTALKESLKQNKTIVYLSTVSLLINILLLCLLATYHYFIYLNLIIQNNPCSPNENLS